MTTTRHAQGQSLVEFALIVPLLLALLLGIIQLGVIIVAVLGLAHSTKEAARVGVLFQDPDPAPSLDTQQACLTEMHRVDSARAVQISTVLSTTMSPVVEASQQRLHSSIRYRPEDEAELCRQGYFNPYRIGRPLTVTLEYDQPLFYGLLGNYDVRLRSESAMRIEPGFGAGQ